MRDTKRERQRHRQREKQAPCREPDMGHDPGTTGSHPEPKADAQLLNHSGVQSMQVLNVQLIKWSSSSEVGNYKGHI